MLNCIPGTKLLSTEPMGSQKGNVWPPLLVVLLGKVNIDRDKCHDGKRRARKGIMEGEAFLAKSRERTETVMRCRAEFSGIRHQPRCRLSMWAATYMARKNKRNWFGTPPR